ncbi:DUF2835 family protein [Trichloromonas sp.]|uniref:DUF2835 family protein n=1 Tax=Trichloromonas sp. TaxID=3069249 RepID=UPI002A3EA19F|nr:DUF2835 family protein [Trichloromonas sp.]
MPQARFTLHVRPEELLRYYRGRATMVAVTADDGSCLRFPAASLRPFVTREGVHGRFLIRFDAHLRLVELRRISG